MLVRLFGKNFRSFKEGFELSMVASNLKRSEDQDRGTVEVEIDGFDEPLKLLRVVGIFGPNASGKSAVFVASQALEWLIAYSSERAKPNSRIACYDPFLLDKSTKNAPVELGCDVVYAQSILRYEITFTSQTILKENLTLLSGSSESVLIDRQGAGEIKGEIIEKSEANKLYVKGMQPNVAILSKLAQHGPSDGEDSVQSYYKSILDSLRFADFSGSRIPISMMRGDEDRFADDQKYQNWVMQHLMKVADVGIVGVETKKEKVEFPEELRKFAEIKKASLPDHSVVVSFVHGGIEDHSIDFSEESAGTKKLFHIAEQWWELAHEPVTLFADELCASLHPMLVEQMIKAINNLPASGPRSQLIFTSHDIGLMESHGGEPPALRRDQIYFTKKDQLGASEIYALAEFKDDARPAHNLRKRYLSGLYGAVPSVDKVSL